jgi:hypothetical protein
MIGEISSLKLTCENKTAGNNNKRRMFFIILTGCLK